MVPSRLFLRITSAALTLAISVALPAFGAGTFYVWNHPSCSNTGPGTEAIPYCSISAAEKARGGPGTTILVKPQIYPEQITVQHSGAVGSPLVIQALGSPVIVDGADDFSTIGQWTQYSGTIYLASTAPNGRMYVDGARLQGWGPSAADVPPGYYTFITGEGMYVNLGGDNPGVHATFIGKRDNSFRLNGRTYVNIEGFSVTRTQQYGFRVIGSSSHIAITSNTIDLTSNSGVSVSGGTDILVASNVVSRCGNTGISFLAGVSDSTIKDNESFGNIQLAGPETRGIKLDGTVRILLQGNRVHHNDNEGVQINNAQDTVSLQNRVWSNSASGFAHLHSTGTVHIGDVSWRNDYNGFFLQASTASLYNCISADSIAGWPLYVDSALPPALVSDSNIFWHPGGGTVIFYRKTSTDSYRSATVAVFSADTGQDVHSLQADPRFVDPVNGDFHLLAGSPAIDSADSSPAAWPGTDAEGRSRVDDSGTTNSGLGPVSYADRGALEFEPPCSGQGQQCGSSDVGECQFGTTQCIGNQLVCVGNVEPVPETCDGTDNDCDGTLDNGTAPHGTPTLSAAPAAGTMNLSWTVLSDADRYDVVKGDLALLQSSGGDFSASTGSCLGDDLGTPTSQDPATPGAGNGFWYVVRGSNACGNGTYDEDDPSQVGLRDPEISASASACP